MKAQSIQLLDEMENTTCVSLIITSDFGIKSYQNFFDMFMNTILLTIHIAILPKEILILHCFWKGGKKKPFKPFRFN